MADHLADLVDVRLASPGVALVTLNLPQVRNAMTTGIDVSLATAMENRAWATGRCGWAAARAGAGMLLGGVDWVSVADIRSS